MNTKTGLFESAIKECQEKVGRGVSISDVIAYLHHQGLDILDSIKIVRQVFGMPLGESKQLVVGHSVWAGEAQKADALHQEIEEALREDQEADGRSIR
jgi:ribosomal protein L7/L12